MKRLITLFTALLLALSFVLAMPAASFAADDDQVAKPEEHNIMLTTTLVDYAKFNKSLFEKQCEVLKNMSKEALDLYIQERCDFVEALKIYKENLEKIAIGDNDFVKIELLDQLIKTNLKLAWYAAAQVAKGIGFYCTGTLIEHSVLGIPYVEKDGLFALKMRFAGLEDKVFDLKESPDLFFAIHGYTLKEVSDGCMLNLYKVTDTFDFDRDSQNYGNELAAFANEIGKLMEAKGVLLPIPVIVYVTTAKTIEIAQ